MTWKALVPTRPWVKDVPGACLRYAQSFFGAPAMHRSAYHAWLALPEKYGPEVPLPGVPVLLWFDHEGTYYDGRGQYGPDPSRPYWGNWGHVSIHVPGDAIYTSPGFAYGFERWALISQIEARFASTYIGWSPVINGMWVAERLHTPTPVPPKRKDEEMSKPMLAMKLDGGPMNTLGVMIDPDGAVTGLTADQWGFWVHTAKVDPIECKNPGHWEYLMKTQAARRERSGVTITDKDVAAIAAAVSDNIADRDVTATAEEVAAVLQITVKG